MVTHDQILAQFCVLKKRTVLMILTMDILEVSFCILLCIQMNVEAVIQFVSCSQ